MGIDSANPSQPPNGEICMDKSQLLSNNPARQKYRYTSVPIEAGTVLGSWIRIRIRIRVKSWIRIWIRIKVRQIRNQARGVPRGEAQDARASPLPPLCIPPPAMCIPMCM